MRCVSLSRGSTNSCRVPIRASDNHRGGFGLTTPLRSNQFGRKLECMDLPAAIISFLSANKEFVLAAIVIFVIFAWTQLQYKNSLAIEDRRAVSEEKRAKHITDNHNEWRDFIEKLNKDTNNSVRELSTSVLALAQTVSKQSEETGEAVHEVLERIDVIHTDINAHRQEFRRFTDILEASRERRGGSHL